MQSHRQTLPPPSSFLAALLGLALTLPLPAQTTTTDDFTNPSNWTAVKVSSPSTSLTVASGRMNYTTATSGVSGAIATWNGPKLPANQNWSLAADAHIDAFTMASFGQFVDVFLGVARTSDVLNTNVLLEFDRGKWGAGLGYDIGDSVTVGGSEVTGILNEYNLTSPDVSLRMDYNAAARTLTYYFDANGATGGYSWVTKGTLPLGPTFDSLGLMPTETFTVMLVGSSEMQTVASGTAYLSNLRATVGGTMPAPLSITAHPAGQTIASGTSATLSVAASGGELIYQWYQGSSGTTTTPVGPNTASFTTPALTKTTSYWVRVSNSIGSVDSNTVIVTVSSTIQLSEAIDQPPQTVTSAGSLPWTFQTFQTTWTHDGVDVAKSGAVTHSQTSEMSTTVIGPGTLSFWWWVSSEGAQDYLRFYIDGVEQTKISGVHNSWTQKSYSLTTGSHTLKWAYTKNSSVSSGSDCGLVDQVVINPRNPYVTTGDPSGVTLTTATLKGTVNPNGLATTAQFEYGLTDNYGSTVTVTLSPNNGTMSEDLTASISGLQPGVSYHYRLNALNSIGLSHGDDATFYTEQPGPFTYKVENKRVTITGYTGSGGVVDIPNAIIGLPVVSIENNAFAGQSSLISMTIPANVTTIGDSAFSGCTGLSSVSIPPSITSIGDSAFYGCTGLSSVTIPSSVTSIGDRSFGACTGLSSVTIPASVISIGYSAFMGCTGLTSLAVDTANTSYSSLDGVLFNKAKTILIQFAGSKAGALSIPTGVTSIGDYAFIYSTGLTSVVIPSSVTSIGVGAFKGCTGLTSVTIPSSVTSIGSGAFRGCTGLTSVTIPDSITSIEYSMFWGCTSLTSITIPSRVTTIRSHAFRGCTGLTNVSIPASVISIGDSVFRDCTSLSSVIIPDSITSIESSMFWGCTSLTSVTIPDSITSIGSGAFFYCTSLTSVTIPSSVNTIGYNAFYGCTGLTSVAIPSSVTDIVDGMFYGCTGLTSVTIPNSVTRIGLSAFEGCTGLTSVSIPASVTSIEYEAFFGCSGLSSIVVDTTNTAYSSLDGVLFNKTKTTLIQCPGSKNGTYSIPPGVTNIGYDAFSGCNGLTSISIPPSVSYIDESAFYGSSGLSSIAVDTANTSYSSLDGVLFNKGQDLLIQCPGGKTGVYLIPSSVTFIYDYAFSGCSGLTGVIIPASVTSIETGTFSGCTGLTSVTIPNSVTLIDDYAFSDCTGLTSISIPASVTSIDYRAFFGCSSLSSIVVDTDNTSYSSLDGVLFNKGQDLLIKCPIGKTGAYIIPSSVTSIEFVAFQNCGGLTSVTIPNSVSSIGDSSFYGCTGLSSVTIPSSVTSIGDRSFGACTSLVTAIFQGNAPLIYVDDDVSIGPFDDGASDFTVYFDSSKTGFTTPTWEGYPAVGLSTTRDISVVGQSGSNIAGGGTSTDFGDTSLGSSVSETFTIRNLGATDLTGLVLSKDGAQAAEFTVSTLEKTTLTPGAETTFTVTFLPTAAGVHSATIHIASNDVDENPYDISLTGLGVTQTTTSPADIWLSAHGFPAGTHLLSDPNGDSVSLLMAYAFNLNPAHNLSSSLPRPVVTADRMNVTFYSGNADVTYLVETSTDLRAWSTVGVTLSPADASGLRTATFLKAGPTRFMRLRPVIKDSVYGPWRAARFSTADLGNAAVSGDLADPDLDGVPNLLEYAMGGQPKTPDMNFAPTAGRVGGYLTLTYRQSKSATDLAFMPQATANPTGGTWSAAGLAETGRVDHVTFWLVTVRDAVPIAAAPSRFIRLTVGR